MVRLCIYVYDFNQNFQTKKITVCVCTISIKCDIIVVDNTLISRTWMKQGMWFSNNLAAILIYILCWKFFFIFLLNFIEYRKVLMYPHTNSIHFSIQKICYVSPEVLDFNFTWSNTHVCGTKKKSKSGTSIDS